MQHMNFDQQRKIFDPAYARPVTVFGAGSVGSTLVVTLAREGCPNITVWDDDTVASHNIPMSEYRQEFDLAHLKVDALADIVKIATGTKIITVPRKYAGEPLNTTIVACVDDMDARQLIWRHAVDNPLVGLLVDTRVAAEYIEVFVIRTCNKEDIEYYGHFLYPSSKALPPTCGWHGAKHVSGTAANAACGALTAWWQGCIPKRHLRMLCGHFQEV